MSYIRLKSAFRYGGVIERRQIVEKADWFIKDFSVLIRALTQDNLN